MIRETMGPAIDIHGGGRYELVTQAATAAASEAESMMRRLRQPVFREFWHMGTALSNIWDWGTSCFICSMSICNLEGGTTFNDLANLSSESIRCHAAASGVA